MVFRFRGNSQVKDKMLTITNLIKESFSFLLLLREWQVKDVGQRHDTLQTQHTAHFDRLLDVNNKPLIHQKLLAPQNASQNIKSDTNLTLRNTVKKKSVVCRTVPIISIYVHICVHTTTSTHTHYRRLQAIFLLPFTLLKHLRSVFCCG